MKAQHFRSVFLLLAALLVFGCKVEADPQAAEELKSGAEKALQSTKDAASKTGEAIAKTSAQVGQTSRIKYVLSTSKDVDTSELSVETIDKTIFLKGSVPNADMRARADRMARAVADSDYTVQDELTVKGGSGNPPITDDQRPPGK